VRLALVLSILSLTSTGCAVFDLLKTREAQKRSAEYGYLAGTVTTRVPGADWMVVYIVRSPCDASWNEFVTAVDQGVFEGSPEAWSAQTRELVARLRGGATVARHVLMQEPGFWYARVLPGCYAVGAFADTDHDYRYDDEPAAAASADRRRLIQLTAGDRREGIDLEILPEGRLGGGQFDPVAMQVRALEARSGRDQLVVSIDEVAVEGEVVALSDERFDVANGRLGYYDIYAYLWKTPPGVYFLEPYDHARIPVLFVHGALSSAQVFRELIAGLDRDRFQPWFFAYPSGANLELVASFLSQTISRLQHRHPEFTKMAVVAHSMGGLVSRSFIFQHETRVRDNPVRLFVSIASPWGGMDSAKKGVDRSPVVVQSWRDVATDSAFLRSLFFTDPETQTTPRHLPDSVDFRLLWSVYDKTVPPNSALRWEALREAEARWPLAYGHTDVLESREASLLVNEILAESAW
jgi:pimeloyl-ACP methyl ester carboxylesterase